MPALQLLCLTLRWYRVDLVIISVTFKTPNSQLPGLAELVPSPRFEELVLSPISAEQHDGHQRAKDKDNCCLQCQTKSSAI